MSFKILETAKPGEFLDGRKRTKPLPPHTKVCLVEATNIHGYHHPGDRWVEYVDDRRIP